MNIKCDKAFCPYKETCLMDKEEEIEKCTGVISIKNPHHAQYSAISKSTN